MHLYLVGYRGSGKSTLGRAIGQRLQWPCIDCDDSIEKSAGKSIREIFAEEGAEGFRDREEAVLKDIASIQNPQVVSLGGGAILRPANRELISKTGICVWLTASPATLWNRILADTSTAERRPPLSNLSGYDEVVELLKQREPLYRAVSQKIVDTETLSAEAIGDDIIQWVRSKGL